MPKQTPKPYDVIAIIYNPKSTGPGQRLAQRLKRQLASRAPRETVQIIPTKRQGHAEELAAELTRRHKHPLIISASGDGGYNEVVNGITSANGFTKRPVAGLLPAGNANDHYREQHGDNLAQAIARHDEKPIDLLSLTARSGGRILQRYAHSYIGVGLTPEAGHKLNESRFKLFSEVWIVAKVLLFLQSVRLVVNGEVRHYDSLVFSNVSRMSKILKLSETAHPDDGRFEVTAFRRRNKPQLIASLLKATTRGLKNDKHVKRYTFKTTARTLVQLDGEILRVDANTRVTVRIAPKALRCIV